MSAPPMRPAEQLVAAGFVLRRHRMAQLAPMRDAVNASLAHLAPWMEWAQEPATDSSVGEFLARSECEFDEGSNFGYAIVESVADRDDVIVGGCGLHRRLGPDAIEIGYWVHVDHVRRGIARAAAVALADHAFDLGVRVAEIHCDERNMASAAVARSAGFALRGRRFRPAQLPTQSDYELIWQASPK